MSSGEQIPAYAIIVVPLPGSYAAVDTLVPPPQLLEVLLNVWLPPKTHAPFHELHNQYQKDRRQEMDLP